MYSEEIKLLDNWRNFEKYMSKWLCIDFIHSWRITPLQHWCFHCCCFFHCIQKKFIHLSWMLTLPIPPLPLPTLAFQIKNCKPFPNLSMNWHFCQIQSSSSLLLKKRKTTQRGQHQYHIFGVPEQALPGGYWGPCLYVILYRLFSYTVLLPIKASWKKQTWPWQPSIGDYYWHEYGNFMSKL